MPLKVIGAGFGRTGTESMRQALNILGVGPCYHMFEVLPHQDRVDLWRAAAKGQLPDWDAAFEGYGATVDWPGATFWPELADHYPDAKILLTTRSPESWYASMEKTILPVLREKAEPDSIGNALVKGLSFKGNIDDRDHMIACYEDNIARVQAAFGPDRLLTYELGSGWQPLCDFLDLPVPDQEYPRSNDKGEFETRMEETEGQRRASTGRAP